MDADKIRWTYGLMKADGTMDTVFHIGPLPEDKLAELLGGEVKLVPFDDGKTAAVRKDETGLPENKHWPVLRGDVVLGGMSDGKFVGALGVPVNAEVGAANRKVIALLEEAARRGIDKSDVVAMMALWNEIKGSL